MFRLFVRSLSWQRINLHDKTARKTARFRTEVATTGSMPLAGGK
jgi:hypothetical protein